MARLLVTGGAGFIGSNFVQYWLTRHPDDRVVVLDALTYAGNLNNLKHIESNPELRFVHGDIADQLLIETLLRQEELDTIVHFAAESHVDRSIFGPDAFLSTNILGTHSLLKAARKVWLDEAPVDSHRFHHVSTDEVYGSLTAEAPPFKETTPYAPNSPYSASKAASDHLVRAYHQTYGLATTISNCSNNYGPYQFPEKLIPLIVINILEGRPLPVYGDGMNIRDWLHVSDHCRGIDLVLSRGTPGQTYNVGGNCERDNLSIVRSLCAIADALFSSDATLCDRFPAAPPARSQPAASLISFVPDRPGHDRRYAIDCQKISSGLGFAPQVEIETGLKETFRWYVANEPWWRSVLEGSYRDWIKLQYK